MLLFFRASAAMPLFAIALMPLRAMRYAAILPRRCRLRRAAIADYAISLRLFSPRY